MEKEFTEITFSSISQIRKLKNNVTAQN